MRKVTALHLNGHMRVALCVSDENDATVKVAALKASGHWHTILVEEFTPRPVRRLR